MNLAEPFPAHDLRSLAGRTSAAMQAALDSFVAEAAVMYIEQFGREPPADKLAALHFAVQQQSSLVAENPDILGVRDTRYVWDGLSDRVIKPALGLALGTAAPSEYARPYFDMRESIKQQTSEVQPPELLLAQFKLLSSKIPGFWDHVQQQHITRQQQDSQRQSAQALAQLAAMSSSSSRAVLGAGAYSRPTLGLGLGAGAGFSGSSGGHPVFSALKTLDAEWGCKPPDERGCKYWSGSAGSCRQGEGCMDAASHIPKQPSQWYLARSQIWSQHGGVKNALGNWSLGKIGGVKRPAPGGADPGASAFQSG
jgi:hypothetical protein